jgi:hypothetical protein
MIKQKDKKGAIGIILLFVGLFLVLIIGFMAVIILSVVDFASEQITPVMTDLGMVGDVNLSQASEYTFGTADTIINALPWLVVFSYVAMIIFTIVFVLSYNYNPNPVFIGLYFIMVILLIFGCIIMSNMYQDIYSGTDEIATGLREQSAMSHLIIHSPWIFAVISFIVGIYLFAGKQTEIQGGYDI